MPRIAQQPKQRSENATQRKKRVVTYPFLLLQHCACILEFNFRTIFINAVDTLLPSSLHIRTREKIAYTATFNFLIHMRFDCPPEERVSKKQSWANLSIHEALRTLMPQFQFCVPPPTDITIIPPEILFLPSTTFPPYTFQLFTSPFINNTTIIPDTYDHIHEWHSKMGVPIVQPQLLNPLFDYPLFGRSADWSQATLRPAPAPEPLQPDYDEILNLLDCNTNPNWEERLLEAENQSPAIATTFLEEILTLLDSNTASGNADWEEQLLETPAPLMSTATTDYDDILELLEVGDTETNQDWEELMQEEDRATALAEVSSTDSLPDRTDVLGEIVKQIFC